METASAILSRIAMMTGQWAELRDMGRDDHFARRIVDAAAYRPGEREEVLLQAVILLLRENAAFRKHTLRILETTHTPLFAPSTSEGAPSDG